MVVSFIKAYRKIKEVTLARDGFSSESSRGGTDVEEEKSNLRLVAGQVFDLIELSQDYVENPAREHKVEKQHPEGGKTFDVLSKQRENGDDK